MATGPSPSTASTEINLAQQAIQLLRQSQGQSGTDRKTIEKVVFKLRVKELKEVCREFKVKISKANKAALCGRIISYWQTGLFREDKFCSPTCSADSPLSVTTPLIRQSLKKVGKLSCFNGDWKRDLSLLSDFTFMDLFTYLVESKDNTFDQGSMRAFKSLKAFRYFADGYVQNVWATEVNQASDLLIIRCYCFSSLKCGTTYPVFVCLSRSGDVYSAECKCVAGLGEACSHVAALLFYLEDCVQRRDKVLPDNSTCTDKLQQWHIPPKRTINPAPVSNIEFRKAEYGNEQEDRPKPTLYDPRHPNDQTLNPEHVSTMLDKLKTTCPTSGIHQFWNLSGESTLTANEKEAMNLVVHAPELGIRLTYPCFDVDASSPQFVDHCSAYARNQKVAPEIACRVERVTKGQSNNALWRFLHNCRITSSRFHDIFVRKATTPPDKLVISLMGYQSPLAATSLPPQIEWGRTREAVARQDYITAMKGQGHQVVVKDCGLSLLANRAYLGASSDGRVYDPASTLQSGVLEIKCPYSIDGKLIIKERVADIVKTHGSRFFLEQNGNQLALKRNSRYYCQVQGEMAILKVPWCDFVVWTMGDIHIERIFFDHHFWEDQLLPKLDSFYVKAMVPEILTGSLYHSLNMQ